MNEGLSCTHNWSLFLSINACLCISCRSRPVIDFAFILVTDSGKALSRFGISFDLSVIHSQAHQLHPLQHFPLSNIHFFLFYAHVLFTRVAVVEGLISDQKSHMMRNREVGNERETKGNENSAKTDTKRKWVTSVPAHRAEGNNSLSKWIM